MTVLFKSELGRNVLYDIKSLSIVVKYVLYVKLKDLA